MYSYVPPAYLSVLSLCHWSSSAPRLIYTRICVYSFIDTCISVCTFIERHIFICTFTVTCISITIRLCLYWNIHLHSQINWTKLTSYILQTCIVASVPVTFEYIFMPSNNVFITSSKDRLFTSWWQYDFQASFYRALSRTCFFIEPQIDKVYGHVISQEQWVVSL